MTDGYDAFCLPDDVLAAIVDLEASAPAAQSAAGQPGAPAPAACKVSMFDAFLPPGPLQPANPGDQKCGSAQGAAPGLDALRDPPLHAMPPGVVAPQSQQLSHAEHCAAVGEAHLLRARLQQVEQQAHQDRQRAIKLQAELQEARSERDSKYETQIQRLASELSFKEHEVQLTARLHARAEVQQARLARAHIQGELDELQAAMLQADTEPDQVVVPGRQSNPTPAPAAAVRFAVAQLASTSLAPLGTLASNSPLFHSRSMRPSPAMSMRKRRATSSPARPQRDDESHPFEAPATSILDAAPVKPTTGSQPTSHAVVAGCMDSSMPPPIFAPPIQQASVRKPTSMPRPSIESTMHVAKGQLTAKLLDPNAATETPCSRRDDGALDGLRLLDPAQREASSQQNPDRNVLQVLPALPPVTESESVPEQAWATDPTQQGSQMLSRLLARAGSSLQRLLLEPLESSARDEMVVQNALAPRLLEAMQLLMVGEDNAPLLLRALQPYLISRIDASSCWRTRASWQLFCLLVIESEQCRRCVLRSHLDRSLDDEANDDLNQLIRLVQLVGELSPQCTGAGVLLAAIRALSTLSWVEPAVCLPCLHAWLAPSEGGESPVFSTLIGPAKPASVRLEALCLLKQVLRSERAFVAFTAPITPLWHSPVLLVVQALNIRQPTTMEHRRRGLLRHASPELHGSPLLASQSWESDAEIPMRAYPVGSDGLCGSLSDEVEDELDGDVHSADQLEDDGPMTPGATLKQAALRLLSSLLAWHQDAAERLLSPALRLALPMRLVSLLQFQVHSLLRARTQQPSHDDLDLVRENVLLLLEIARGPTSMQQALKGGSWGADLTSATLHLVRNEVHPQLSDLSTPAKLLQNAITG